MLRLAKAGMMALAVNQNKWQLWLVLCISVYNTELAKSDSRSIIGSNVSTPTQASTLERFYLNTARPAPCNGTITHLRYCYYGREDSDSNAYQALVALYRPEPGGINNYQRITNTVSIIKQTPSSQFPPADALLPGFNCDSIELEENVQIFPGDVIGACIYDTLISIRRLDVVSLNDNAGYHMLYNSADDEDCENRVLPEVVGRNLEQTISLRILHVFAVILPTDVEIRNEADITVPPNSQDQSITITAIVVGGSAVILIFIMITIIVTTVACFIAKKRKQRNSSDYSYTANLTYNIRSGQVDMEDGNERTSDSQSPTTVPYYDYIEGGTPRLAGSRKNILSSSGSDGSMVQNRAYRSQQEANLHNTSVCSHSMVQNQAYRSHQVIDLQNSNDTSVFMVQNRAYT